jgi:hypothetical protein
VPGEPYLGHSGALATLRALVDTTEAIARLQPAVMLFEVSSLNFCGVIATVP